MAIPGQRFELELDADDFTINPIDDSSLTESFRIKDIQEHDSNDVPAPPKPKASNAGFPEHKQRKVSRFRQKQDQSRQDGAQKQSRRGPSDAAIAHRLSQKQGTGVEARQKEEISQENDYRLAAMSAEEIEDARAEIMGTLSPALLERLLKRSRIDDEVTNSDPEPPPLQIQSQESDKTDHDVTEEIKKRVTFSEGPESTVDNGQQPEPEPQRPSADTRILPSTTAAATTSTTPNHNVHFPAPPRSAADYRTLDPSSPDFLSDLKSTYFPELAHTPNPSALEWLQTPSPQDREASSYSPSLTSYPASSIRFTFFGQLLAPSTSLSLPTTLGLHHHGDAPDSAGYTIPELTLLARSTLPNQRCVAYRTIGRILFGLGKEEFGKRGSELYEALWAEVEKERTLEFIMAEAGREKGHVSARAYATEALWLWRKGCDGERGLRQSEEGMWEEGLTV